MRKRIYAGALAAIIAVSSITATGGTVYAADDKPTICSPDNIEEIINEISEDNVIEKVLLLEPGDYGAIIIDKPHVTVKSQDPKNPAVFKGTDIPQRDSLSDDEAEKLRSSMIQISASDVKVEGVEIKGLTIKDPGYTNPIGIEVINSADNIYIDNCTIHDMGCVYTKDTYEDTGFNAHGIIVKGENESDPCENIHITNCNLYNLVLGNSEAMVVNGNVTNFDISGNTVHDCDNIGIDVIGYEHCKKDKKGKVPANTNDRARNGSVTNNFVYNISSGSNLTYRESPQDKIDSCAGGIYVDGGVVVTISDNYVGNSDIGIELASEHYGGSTDGITVKNNILVNNNSLGGISIGGSGNKNGVAVNCTITENTVYTDSGICFRIQKADSETNGISKNIFIADGKKAVTFANENGSEKNVIKDNYVTKADAQFTDNKIFKLGSKNVKVEKRVFEFTSKDADITGYGAGAKVEEKPAEPEVTTEEPIVVTEEPIETTEEPIVTSEEEPVAATEEPIIVTEESSEEDEVEDPVVSSEEELIEESPVQEAVEPDWNVTGDSSVYTVSYNDDIDGYKVEYKKKHSENWEPVVLNFENVDLSEYSKVNITVVPSRKNMNLGITNMDDDDPIFYRDHWSKKGKFSSTKEQTVTIKLDEENVKGFYLYLDATSSDKVNKKTKYTFKITNVDFE